MGFTIATGIEENKFSSLTFGRQATGHMDTIMIHGRMSVTETDSGCIWINTSNEK